MQLYSLPFSRLFQVVQMLVESVSVFLEATVSWTVTLDQLLNKERVQGWKSRRKGSGKAVESGKQLMGRGIGNLHVKVLGTGRNRIFFYVQEKKYSHRSHRGKGRNCK